MNENESKPIEAPHDAKVRRVELLISGILKVGVMVSLALVVIGTVLSFVHHPEYVSQPAAVKRLTTPGAAFPHSVREVFSGLVEFRGQAVVTLGLLLLISTPVVRVAVSIFGFVYEGDRKYVVITSIVLALLLLSFFLGKGE